ncbi:MAG: DUF3849 domain-containing protein [Oscillospiraceae bacterium]|nr:DUF3849 domain-containing protein [Oscillospiraceae bacterium]
MASKFGPLYTDTRLSAERYNETELWDQSFRLNVCCARAIEEAIRDSSRDDEAISPDCAKPVLEKYGIQRTMYVLAHSVKEFGPLVHASEEIEAWARSVHTVPDSAYGRYYEVNDAVVDLEAFIAQTREAYQALGLFGQEHCSAGMYDENVEYKVLVMKPNTLNEESMTPHNQLWLATGGFGCNPKASGRAIYATNLGDGTEARWNREDFVGVLDEQYLPDWAQSWRDALLAPMIMHDAAPQMGGMEMG